jgi:ATP-binding cassette subfamily G (WHITE) protein 2 (PDR)
MFSLRPHRTLDPSRILETLDESTTAAADEQDLSITTTWTEDNISALARSITRTPTDIEHESDLYHPIQDSDLDPHSPAFNPRTWAKAIVQLERSSTATNLIRKSGIAFQGLSVYGEKSDFAYQNTFGNAPLKLWSTLRAILTGVGRHRVSILDEVEGVLDTGEMLLVLGPPGSGCSTLLKSIAGETDATSVTENAMMNYRGS